MIDLHCHILPGVDDGPRTLDESLAMARAHVAAGVRTVSATPHVSWNIPTRPETVAGGVELLRGELDAAGIALDLVTGGEIALDRATDLEDAELAAFALGGGPWLLLEAPLSPTAGNVEHLFQTVAARGYGVVIAHPERCPAFQREPGRLGALVRGGMLTSITASALTGRFGRTAMRLATDMVREGLVHTVASDAHDAGGRPPGLREPIEEAGYGSRTELWCEEVPAAILAGEPVPAVPPPDERSAGGGLLARLRRRS